jgi:hypothetical protein
MVTRCSISLSEAVWRNDTLVHNHTHICTPEEMLIWIQLKQPVLLPATPTGTLSRLTVGATQRLERRPQSKNKLPTHISVRIVHIPIRLQVNFAFRRKLLHLHSAHPDEAVHTWRTSRKCQRSFKEKIFLNGKGSINVKILLNDWKLFNKEH